MTPKITSEQRAALNGHVGPLAIRDEQTQQLFFLLDQASLDKLQREADRAAIREGIADMEAGRVMTLEQLDARIRATEQFTRELTPEQSSAVRAAADAPFRMIDTSTSTEYVFVRADIYERAPFVRRCHCQCISRPNRVGGRGGVG